LHDADVKHSSIRGIFSRRPFCGRNLSSADSGNIRRGTVYEDFARCVHCGLCLNNCPTYRSGILKAIRPRSHSPDDSVGNGELPLAEGFVGHIDKCLDCRACETACPSGVEYGNSSNTPARALKPNTSAALRAFTRNIVFKRCFLPNRIAFAARLLRFYQRSGLHRSPAPAAF